MKHLPEAVLLEDFCWDPVKACYGTKWLFQEESFPHWNLIHLILMLNLFLNDQKSSENFIYFLPILYSKKILPHILKWYKTIKRFLSPSLPEESLILPASTGNIKIFLQINSDLYYSEGYFLFLIATSVIP